MIKLMQGAFAFVLAFCAMLFIMQVRHAYPHDWYSDKQKPGTTMGCCGGTDCFSVDIEEVVERKNDFVITLNHKRKNKDWLLIGVPYIIEKKFVQPSQASKKDESGYHACIMSSGEFRCFFAPTDA